MLYDDFRNSIRDPGLLQLSPWCALTAETPSDPVARFRDQIERWYAALGEEDKPRFKARLLPHKKGDLSDFVGATTELYAMNWFARIGPELSITYESAEADTNVDLVLRVGCREWLCEVYSPSDLAGRLTAQEVHVYLGRLCNNNIGPGHRVIVRPRGPTGSPQPRTLEAIVDKIAAQRPNRGAGGAWKGKATTAEGVFEFCVGPREDPSQPTVVIGPTAFRSVEPVIERVRKRIAQKARKQLNVAPGTAKLLFILSAADLSMSEDDWFRVFYGAPGPPVVWGRRFPVGPAGLFTEHKQQGWHRSYISAAVAGNWDDALGATDAKLVAYLNPHAEVSVPETLFVAYLNPHAEVSVPETLFQGIPIYRLVPGRDAILMERVPPLVEE